MQLSVRAGATYRATAAPSATRSTGGAATPAAAHATPAALDELYAPAQGKEGAALLRTLHDITAATHRPLGYEAARTALFATVEDPSKRNVIVDLYSGERIADVPNVNVATEKGLTTEHVWPQSEGATEEAKGDLHALRPELGLLNSYRSNLPYGVVETLDVEMPSAKDVEQPSVVGEDHAGEKVFMPRAEVRGDLARDQLYFFTRYHGDRPEGYTNDNFRHSLQTLLQWHREDPVDGAERARNDAIELLQGNRNPYVDHPEFVDRLGLTNAMITRTRPKGA